jgi:hypothetical protein
MEESNPSAPARQPKTMEFDPAAFLARERQAVREQFAVQPLTHAQWVTAQDAIWAQHDGEVQAKYQGEFVVPVGRRIIAHGRNAAEVLAEAARVTGKRAEELPLVGIVNPLLDIPH